MFWHFKVANIFTLGNKKNVNVCDYVGLYFSVVFWGNFRIHRVPPCTSISASFNDWWTPLPSPRSPFPRTRRRCAHLIRCRQSVRARVRKTLLYTAISLSKEYYNPLSRPRYDIILCAASPRLYVHSVSGINCNRMR